MALVPPLGAQHTSIVTGASSGIGAQTALGLARAGSTVVVVGRNQARTEQVVAQIRAQTANPHVHPELADFSSLAQVDDLATRLIQRCSRIDLLVNNAGLWRPDRTTTADGFEQTFAVNHLAPFLLTRRLLDRLKDSAPARVVTVSSRIHWQCNGIHPEDPFFEQRPYRGLEAYAQSKLANVLFANELARRLEGTGVTSTSVHPGDVATAVVRHNWGLSILMKVAHPFLLTPWEGAQTTLHAGTSTELAGRTGLYFDACSEVASSPASLDAEAARALWARTETWVDR